MINRCSLLLDYYLFMLHETQDRYTLKLLFPHKYQKHRREAENLNIIEFNDCDFVYLSGFPGQPLTLIGQSLSEI